MAALLLDTNIVIHIVNETWDKLALRLRNAIARRDVSFVVSAVSIWEIAIKLGTGRLQMEKTAAEIPAVLQRLNVSILPMSIDHALEVAHPEPATKDPFDRLLLAVCASEGLKLLTTDTKLAGHRLVY
jgi:PIN domain nuclease of toxin-antitoxin system